MNRPVSEEQVAKLADRVESWLRRKGPVITSQQVGLEVASTQKLDQVAYLRFASVYKDFQELGDFEREMGSWPRRSPRSLALKPQYLVAATDPHH